MVCQPFARRGGARPVSDGDRVERARDELYGADPARFMERRTALAGEARAAKDTAAAKAIAALRKPTRSASVVNRLARADPDAASRLLELGSALRAAQRAADGAEVRALSGERRALLDELTSAAFRVSGERSPSDAIRAEVSATLGAAMADDAVGERFRAGLLERAAESEGFGFGLVPDLSVVPDPAERAQTARRRRATEPPAITESPEPPKPTEPTEHSAPARRRTAQDRARERAEQRARDEEAAAAREEATRARRAAAIAEAEARVLATRQAAEEAEEHEQALDDRVEELVEQLADARRRYHEARLDTKRAQAEVRKAEASLDQAKE